MSTINELHSKAMDLAETAFFHSRKGESILASQYFAKALELERRAAYMLSIDEINEPSRSILFRSAASLAFNAGDPISAERLAAQGLAGFPPPEIQEELRDLLEEIAFYRHLSTHGMQLSEAEWKMTLDGSAVKKGVVLTDLLMARVEKVSSLVRRTVERKLGLPFQVNRGVPDGRRDRYGLFTRAFAPSSFAVIFQLGQPDEKQIPLFTGELEPVQVIDEVLTCLSFVENEHVDLLSERIPDQDYLENFIGLARQIAPDGKDIKTVGFTVLRGGEESSLAIRKNRKAIGRAFSRVTKQADNDDSPGEILVLNGVLNFASSPRSKSYGTVKLIDLITGKHKTIHVRKSLMKDIVQPYYEENVQVTVIKKGETLFLDDVASK
jgi:hypothetical protein